MASRTRLMDIAEQAGVSTATVSRVLNSKAVVAEETRRAVLSALDLLGYERPEKLRARSAGLIGLVVPELSNPVFPVYAQHIESELSANGYTPLLCTQAPGGVTEDQYIEVLVEHRVDGIIFVSGLHADSQADVARYDRLVAQGIPFVTINGTNPKLSVPAFAVNEDRAMDTAVNYLVSLGHQRIGLAIGQPRFMVSQLKRCGFTAAISNYLGNVEPLISSTVFTQEGGTAAAAALVDQGVTAIVCASDMMALGAINQVRARGLRVPEDVSVVGFDDSAMFAHTDPPLTTLRQPVASICRSAVSTLVSAIDGARPRPTEILFDAELIVRRSTTSAPTA